MKPIIVTSGEPAGIGPDLCLDLVEHPAPVVVLGDPDLLRTRATLLGKTLNIEEYHFDKPFIPSAQRLMVCPLKCSVVVQPGFLNPDAAHYVIEMLTAAARYCLEGQAAAVVTAPVHKAIINHAGLAFSGHTEFFADLAGSPTVMLLAGKELKVSLVTTHLPLHKIPTALTQELLHQHLTILYHSLQKDFGIEHPRLKILGLNPHAGEDGYLGHEEQRVITPVIAEWQQRGAAIQGPYSADTAFLDLPNWDVVVAMYHDQGLPVLKYASFGHAVNVTCGLPFIRTSVDHGTALELAGTGRASSESLLTAVDLAQEIIGKHAQH